MKTMRTARRALAIVCTAVIASFALAGSAFAATVHGTDYYGTGSALESGKVDVLTVDGNAGEMVFLTVKAGDKTLARNLPYTIGENASADSDAEWTGVATLDIDGLDLGALDGTYVIEAYSNRAGDELLYSGGLYGVYADLPDGTIKLIGTRTANEVELDGRSFNPAESLFSGGHTYRLVGQNASVGGALHFAYEEYDEATTIDGVVKYTNANGDVIASTKIPGLAYGEERPVEIPAVVTADNGDLYRTVFFKDSVTAVNPGKTSFNVYCAQMSESAAALDGYYLATIQMVDEQGRVIASDSVDVTGEFLYTAPASIYKTEMIDGEATVVTYNIDGSQTMRLSAVDDHVMNHERTVTFNYTTQPLDTPQVTVTYNLLDGSKRVSDKSRVLGTQQLVATEEEPTVTPAAEIEVAGTKYYLVGDPSDYAYTLRSGAVPTVDAYYVPEGYEAPGAYDVTVNYVNFLTGAVVESHSYTSDPDQNSRIVIDTPATFSADGVDYVRLDGQGDEIQHSYYSGIASYTVYYRDVNDTLSAGTVINTIRVVYVDGTTAGGAAVDENGITIFEGGVEGIAAAVGSDGANAVADGATSMLLNAGRAYNVFDGEGNNATLTNEAGVNSNTERIEESETPLASGFDKGGTSTAAASFMSTSSWVLPVAIGIIVVIVALLALLAIRRRKNNDMYEL